MSIKKTYEILDNVDDEMVKVTLLTALKKYIENINDESKELFGYGWLTGQLAMAMIQKHITEDERKTIEAEVRAEKILLNPPKVKPKKKNNDLTWKDIIMFLIFVVLGIGFGFYLQNIISVII